MPYADPDLRLADYFLYGVITGISLVIIASILMWRAAKWEIEQITEGALEDFRRSELELAEQLRKYQLENEFLREEIQRLRGGSMA